MGRALGSALIALFVLSGLIATRSLGRELARVVSVRGNVEAGGSARGQTHLRLWGDVNRLMVRAAVLIYPRELDLHRLVLLDHHGQELPDTV